MSAANRTQLINKLYKVAKKLYPPVAPPSNRSVLEHMLYACCLENSLSDPADESFAKLEQQYFDWNEVRVTTTNELAESMKGLYSADAAALSVKKTLHGIFETYYKFDLDFLKKENLRKTVQEFGKFRGVSPFIVSYSAQMALGGHSIPLDDAMMQLMYVLGIVTENEASKGKVPGLERTIAKSKGIEFFSCVHQLAAAFHKAPFSKDTRATLLTIASDANDRFPKRGGTKKPEPVAEKPKKAAAKKEAAKPAAKKSTKKTAPAKVSKAAKKKVTKKKKVVKKAPAKKKTSRAAAKSPAKKKKTVAKKAGRATKKKSPTRSLSKRKPR